MSTHSRMHSASKILCSNGIHKDRSHSVRAYRGWRLFRCPRRLRVTIHVLVFTHRQHRKPEVAWTVISCLEPETNEVSQYGCRDHLHRPSRRCVDNIAGITNRFPQGNPMLQIANQSSTVRYKENSRHLPQSFLTALRLVSSGIARALLQQLVTPPRPYSPLLLERVPLVAPGSSGRSKERGL